MQKTIDEKEIAMEYREYLKTDTWNEKRKARLKIDGHRCQMCGSSHCLEVHHITYRNKGHENVWKDLVTLCAGCHEKVHRMMNRLTAPDRHGWKDTLSYAEPGSRPIRTRFIPDIDV